MRPYLGMQTRKIFFCMNKTAAAGWVWNQEHSVDGDVVCLYHCEDNAANTTVTDATGNHNGTMDTNTSNVYTASGKFSGGFYFNALYHYTIADNVAFDLSTVTIEWFMKFDNNFTSASGSDLCIMYKLNTVQSGEWIIRMESDTGSCKFGVYNGAAWEEIDSATVSWTAGTWYHVAITMDAVNGMELFVDGVSDKTEAGNYHALAGTPDIQVGSNAAGSAEYDGVMDEIAISSVVRY